MLRREALELVAWLLPFAGVEVRRAHVAAQILEELLDLGPGIHEERLSIHLLRLQGLVDGRNGGFFSVVHERCLILGHLMTIQCSIDR